MLSAVQSNGASPDLAPAVKIRNLADEMRRLGREAESDGYSAALAAAGSALHAAADRLIADLTIHGERLEDQASPDLSPKTVGQLHVDRASRRVVLAGREIHTTPLEFQLLCVLISDPTRVFEKRELYRVVWGSEGTAYRTLDTHAFASPCVPRTYPGPRRARSPSSELDPI